jgi:muconolactone delta-isomerase
MRRRLDYPEGLTLGGKWILTLWVETPVPVAPWVGGEPMEYLVTMTTQVPKGTSDDAVDAIRAKEAVRSRQLAVEGHLRRLWRPPLQPGEWRTVGLFAADTDAELETILSSMPLRVWRTDEPTPLSPHPNDPAMTRAREVPTLPGAEFLTTFMITIPEGTPPEQVTDTWTREAQRADELALQGHLLRLWTLPPKNGVSRSLALWRARDSTEIQSILRSLPMDSWMTVETTPLSQHPNDPAATIR